MKPEDWEVIVVTVTDHLQIDESKVHEKMDLSDVLEHIRSEIILAIEEMTGEQIADQLIGWTKVSEIVAVFENKEALANQLEKMNIKF